MDQWLFVIASKMTQINFFIFFLFNLIFIIVAQSTVDKVFSDLEDIIQNPNCEGDGTGNWEYVARYLCNEDNVYQNFNITPRAENNNDAFLICCKISNDGNPLANKREPTVPIETLCGRRHENGLYGTRETHEKAITQFGEFPWMGALIQNDKPAGERKIFKCGVSLIHKQVALTAGHCVYNFKPSELTAVFGEWDSTSTNESMSRANIEIDEIVIHDKFDMPTLFNNIALLFLSEEVPITYHINTVCLPFQDQTPSPNIGCLTAGWGKREVGNPEILQSADLPILTRDRCQAALRQTRVGPYFNLDKSFICTGEREGQGQCIGDGGSPLFCRRSQQYVQFGIVSFNMECNPPTVYTNVALFIDWIKRTMSAKNYVIPEE